MTRDDYQFAEAAVHIARGVRALRERGQYSTTAVDLSAELWIDGAYRSPRSIAATMRGLVRRGLFASSHREAAAWWAELEREGRVIYPSILRDLSRPCVYWTTPAGMALVDVVEVLDA